MYSVENLIPNIALFQCYFGKTAAESMFAGLYIQQEL